MYSEQFGQSNPNPGFQGTGPADPRYRVEQAKRLESAVVAPQTYIFPVNQPQASAIYQQPVAAAIQVNQGSTLQRTDPIPPVSQPQRHNTERAINASVFNQPASTGPVDQLGGAIVAQTYTFPRFSIVYRVSRSILSGAVNLMGATQQQTYLFPLSQPDPTRTNPLVNQNRFLVDVIKQLDGSNQAAFLVPPINQPQRSNIERTLFSSLFQQSLVTGPADQLDGPSSQQTFPIPPVSQPQRPNTDNALFSSLFQQPSMTGPIEQLDGPTHQQTFPIPPVNQPQLLSRFDINRIVAALPRLESPLVQQTFPVSQPLTYLSSRQPVQPTSYFDGATTQQQYIFPPSQPQLLGRFDTNRIVGAAPRFEGATVDTNSFLFPLSQPQLLARFDVNRIVGAPLRVDGATLDRGSYIFPLSQPLIYLASRQPLSAAPRIEGATLDRTWFGFPLSQPVLAPPPRFQPLVIPRFDGAVTDTRSYIFPPSQPLVYLASRQPIGAPPRIDGATVDSTWFGFPPSQPVLGPPQRLQPLVTLRLDGTVADPRSYLFPPSQPLIYLASRQPIDAPKNLEGATSQQTDASLLFLHPQITYRAASMPLAAVQYFDGPVFQQTYIFPLSQPLIPLSSRQPVGAKLNPDTVVAQTYVFPPSQPQLLARFDVNRIIPGPARLDGATRDTSSYLFPVSQPLVYLASRQPLQATPYFEGATVQQTYIFPPSQPDQEREAQRRMLRFIVEAPKRLDGPSSQQTYVFPTNEPELRRFNELTRLDSIVDAPRYWYGFAVVQPQTYVFPVSQPLTPLSSRQPVQAPVYFEGTTRQQTYVFPPSQPLVYSPVPYPVQAKPYFDGSTHQQTYIFPLSQPQTYLASRQPLRAPAYPQDTIAQQTYTFTLLQPLAPQPARQPVPAPLQVQPTQQQTYIFPVSQPQTVKRVDTQPVSFIDFQARIQVDFTLLPIDLRTYAALQLNRFNVPAPTRLDGATHQQTYIFPPSQPLTYLPWRLPIDATRYWDGAIVLPNIPIRPTGTGITVSASATITSANPLAVVACGRMTGTVTPDNPSTIVIPGGPEVKVN